MPPRSLSLRSPGGLIQTVVRPPGSIPSSRRPLRLVPPPPPAYRVGAHVVFPGHTPYTHPGFQIPDPRKPGKKTTFRVLTAHGVGVPVSVHGLPSPVCTLFSHSHTTQAYRGGFPSIIPVRPTHLIIHSPPLSHPSSRWVNISWQGTTELDFLRLFHIIIDDVRPFLF